MNRLKNSYSTCMECGGKKMKSGGKWIQKVIKNPGSFTKQAQSAGMSTAGFKNKVLGNKEDYSTTTVRRANLANTLSKMRKGRDGMITRKGVKDVMEYASRVEPRGITTESSMGMPIAPETIESPANWYNESIWDKAQEENAARPMANAPAQPVDLAKQAERENVRQYQQMMNRKYNAGLVEDGAWGKNTQAAYEKYMMNKPKAKPAATAAPVVAAAKPAAKVANKVTSQNWNYTPSQWDAAQRENAARPVAGAGYGPTRANMVKYTPAKAAAPKSVIAAPSKSLLKANTGVEQMPAWAQKVIADNAAKSLRKPK
jgi:hypothetical protein